MFAARCLVLVLVLVLVVSTDQVSNNESDFSDSWVSSDIWLYPRLPIAAPWSNDERCREDSRRLILNLKNRTLWAMQMWDSSATSVFGLLYGNRYHFGSYDECLAVSEPIQAQFCNVKLRAHVHLPELESDDPFELDPSPTASVWKKLQNSRRDPSKNPRDEIYWGVCVPVSCNQSEVEKNINRYLSHLNVNLSAANGTTYSAKIPDRYCLDNEEDEFTAGEIGFWAFSTLLVLLVVLSTSLDLALTKSSSESESRLRRLLMTFSVKRNMHRMIERDESGDAKELRLIYGLRFYNVCYIVTDHRVGIFVASAVYDFQRLEQIFRGWQNMVLPHGDLFVDTYFFIGGLLASTILLDVYRHRFVNPILPIAHRYFRLVPLYFFIVWFHSSALLRLGSGPAWKPALQQEVEFCQKNWWANVLFIQNYVNPKEMCMMHAWYLPCDLHFFILAVFLIMMIKKNRVLGMNLLYFVTLLSIVTPGIITYMYELNPTVIFYHGFLEKPREDPTFELLYIKSHTRATVYLLGLITGHFLFTHRDSKRTISTLTSVLGCLAGLALLFAPMAYGSLYYDPRRPYNIIESSIFASLRRTIWGLAWVLFMLINRFGKIPIIGPLFEWRISVPLSKATYAIYLIHFIIQMAEHAKAKIPYQFITYDMFVKGTNDLAFSLGYAIVLYFVVELPFRLIFKELLYSRGSRDIEVEETKIQEVVRKTSAEVPRVLTVKL